MRVHEMRIQALLCTGVLLLLVFSAGCNEQPDTNLTIGDAAGYADGDKNVEITVDVAGFKDSNPPSTNSEYDVQVTMRNTGKRAVNWEATAWITDSAGFQHWCFALQSVGRIHPGESASRTFTFLLTQEERYLITKKATFTIKIKEFGKGEVFRASWVTEPQE